MRPDCPPRAPVLSRATPAVATAHAGRTRGEAGAIMLYILLLTGLVGTITSAVILFIISDLTSGVRQLQIVRAFNVAEGGVHYAMARMQEAGAEAYAGETLPIRDGETLLGTAAITVRCLDDSMPPCTGTQARYRRITSTGVLPSGGPRRTVVAVVEGFPSGLTGYAICALGNVTISQGITVYGDVAANGTIALQGPSSNYGKIDNDPPPPYTNNGYYTGSARAAGSITCSVSCAVQVAGTTSPNAPSNPCPTDVALPPFAPGTGDRTVDPPGWTMDATTGYDWDEITLNAAGDASGCSTGFTDLRIQTGAAGTTTVVNIRKLTLGRCGRLVILGDGRVDLRISEEATTALYAGQYSRFGMLSTDTWSTPAPVPAGRLIVSIRSAADPAVHFDRASVIAGTFNVPNGVFDTDRGAAGSGEFYGAVLADDVEIDRDFVFTYDPTATLGASTFGNFNRLRSWKDQ